MSGNIPAGWYPDPENPALLRYWDGVAWTEHRAPVSDDASGVEPGSTTRSGVGRRLSELKPIHWIAAAAVVVLVAVPLVGAGWARASYEPRLTDAALATSERSAAVQAAVERNHSLKRADAEVLASLGVLAEHNPHVDVDALCSRLETLTVEYPTALQAWLHQNGGDLTSAGYRRSTNAIEYFVTFNDVEPLLREHEAMHVLHPNNWSSSSVPGFVSEGTAELLAHEYFAEDPWTVSTHKYMGEVAAVKALFELLGRDTMLRALAADDRTVLTKAMAKLHGSEEEADRVLMTLSPLPNHPNPYNAAYGDSLLEPLAPYFEARFGEGYVAENERLQTYERVFLTGSEVDAFPEVYYFKPATQ